MPFDHLLTAHYDKETVSGPLRDMLDLHTDREADHFVRMSTAEADLAERTSSTFQHHVSFLLYINKYKIRYLILINI